MAKRHESVPHDRLAPVPKHVASADARRAARDAAAPEPSIASALHEGLASSASPLEAGVRSDMEARFGRDFSDVRVHTDRKAAESARDLGARAYTVGRDVVLGGGPLSPGDASDRRLLAHELAHVAQPTDGRLLSRPGDASEREAGRAADAIDAGRAPSSSTTAGALVQRDPLDDATAKTAGDELYANLGPFGAAAVGSDTLDGFDTGKSDLKPAHLARLKTLAHSIVVLLRTYNASTVAVVGHADRVGEESPNLTLGASRAEVVKAALVELGVPESVVTTESKGEGEPLAVPTKDGVPNAKNRRVEVLFRPRSLKLPGLDRTLTPPSTGGVTPETKPKIDINYHPKIDPNPTPDYFKPIPPLPKGSGPKSVIDVIGEKVLDPVIDKVAGGLSKGTRDKLKDAARSAVKSGAAKGARAAAEAAGVTDPAALDAIEKAAEAAIQEKGKGAR